MSYVSQGSAPLLYREGLRKDFRDDYDMYEPEHPAFIRTGTTDKPEVSATIFTSLSRMYEVDDGESPVFERPVPGPKVSAVDKEFAVGVQIGRKAIEDDLYGKLKQSAKWLAHAARMTYEYRAAAFLDDAFSGSTFLGVDGKKLCATDHTFLNAAGTWSNAAATPVGFSVTGVTALLDLAMLAKDHNGDPIKVMPDTVIIGNNAADYHKALQIFGSDKDPFTANNADNAIKKRMPKPKIEISRFKTSTKSYFMIDSKLNDAWFLVRRAVNMHDWKDEKTGAIMAKVDTRFIIWFVDPRGWYGSNPS